LEHNADIRAWPDDGLSLNANFARRWAEKARDHPQQGRFPAAGRPDKNEKLSLIDPEIEWLKR
jgi:hypothetical protein